MFRVRASKGGGGTKGRVRAFVPSRSDVAVARIRISRVCSPWRRDPCPFIGLLSTGEGGGVGSWESRCDDTQERSLRGAGGARRPGGEVESDTASRRWARPREARWCSRSFHGEGSARLAAPLMRARERWTDGSATARRSPVKRRPAPDASGGGEASGRCGT